MTEQTPPEEPDKKQLIRHIGKRLEEARVEAGFKTAKEFSDTFGYAQPTYIQHENGNRSQIEFLPRYAKDLGKPVDWFLRDDNNGVLKAVEAVQVGAILSGQTSFPSKEMETIGQKIRRARKACNLTQAQFAEKMGFADHTPVSKIEADKINLSVSQLEKALEVLGLDAWDVLSSDNPTSERVADVLAEQSLGSLPTPKKEEQISSIIDEGEFVPVTEYNAAASAGHGRIVDPNAEPRSYHLFQRQWLNLLTSAASEHLAVIRVDGDSMEPTLFDGDLLLIDRTQTRASRNGIYVIRFDENVWVKRLSVNLQTRNIQVLSDNKFYPPQEVSADDVHIIGRALWIVGRKI